MELGFFMRVLICTIVRNRAEYLKTWHGQLELFSKDALERGITFTLSIYENDSEDELVMSISGFSHGKILYILEFDYNHSTFRNRIKEQLNPANSISDVLRPSRYHTTNPHTMPKGSPLKNIAITFNDGGNTANANNAAWAARIIPTSILNRLWRVTSETTLIPIIFDKA